MLANKNDNGGRRSGIDRRVISYYVHIPERRSEKDARSGIDRRQPNDDYCLETEEKRSYSK